MRVVMVVMSDVIRDARVRRQARALVDAGHQVTVIGDRVPTGTTTLDGAQIVGARPPVTERDQVQSRSALQRPLRWLLLPAHRRRHVRAFQRAAMSALAHLKVDVVHAHDLSALPVGAEIARTTGARLVYDAHECWSGRKLEGAPEPLGRLADRRRERNLGRQADAVLTVSDGLADWLRHTYGWGHITVVQNTFPCVPGHDLSAPSPPTGVLYAGRIDAKRDLHTFAAAAKALAPLTAQAVGPADPTYLDRLRATGLELGPPLTIDDVDAAYRASGIALISLTDDSENHRVALPNKLFQAVRSGTPVVAADLPELERVVTRYGLGALYRPGDPTSLAEAAHTVAAGHDRFVSAVVAARAELNWNRDRDALLAVYERLTGDR